jgi:hypothetical protein
LLQVPEGRREAFVVRVADPFPGVAIDQLLVEFRLGEAASEGVIALATARRDSRGTFKLARAAVITMVVATTVTAILEIVRHWH